MIYPKLTLDKILKKTYNATAFERVSVESAID